MRLKELRKRKMLTQEQVAKKIGITQYTYSNYENNKTQPNYKTLIKLADFFNVSIDYLINHKTKNKNSKDRQELINTILNLNERTFGKIEALVFGYLSSYNEYKGV